MVGFITDLVLYALQRSWHVPSLRKAIYFAGRRNYM